MYRELDDNELLFMVEENQNYYEILLNKYKPLIIKISKKYYKLGKKVGYEFEDIIQIGTLGLLESIKSFKGNKNILFYTYITCCLENKIKTEIRFQLTDKRKMLNKTISYDEVIEGTDKPLIDFIEDKNAVDPYEELIEHEIEEKYINFIQSLPLEVAVAFEMRNDGFTYEQIGRFLQMDNQTIIRSINFVKQRICLN